MKILLTICILTVACFCNGQSFGITNTPPSDAMLSRQITGTWTRGLVSWTEEPLYSRTISSDGSFTTSIGHTNALVTYQGIWLVKDQVLVMTITNAHGTGTHKAEVPVGSVDSDKIIHLDNHQFTYQYIYKGISHTNTLTRR
jgi:hypothetical protein